jgi:hypothetical protein
MSLNDEELKRLIEAINHSTTATVEATVNGKIKRIDEKLSQYIDSDLKWKEERVEPLIEAHSTIKNVGLFIKWAAGIVISVGVLIKLFFVDKIF